MRTLVLLIVALLTSHCGNGMSVNPNSSRFLYKDMKDLPEKHRDADLQKVLDAFIAEAVSRGLDPWGQERHLRVLAFQEGLSAGNMPPIKGTHAEGKAPAGLCVTAREVNPANRKTVNVHHFVYLDASLKDAIDTSYFKAIAYHEFFHCLFNGRHGAPLDMKTIETPQERMNAHIEARSADAEESATSEVLSAADRSEIFEASRREYYDEIAERHGIMAPGLIYDQRFWEEKWDEMVEKLFAEGR